MKTFQEFINESTKNYIETSNYDWVSLFEKINVECFFSKLDIIPISVKWLTNASARFYTKIDHKTKKTSDYKIVISNGFRMTEEQAKNLLCHEMIHFYVCKILKFPYDNHGDKFKAEMDRINKIKGYQISLKDDEPKAVNYDEIGILSNKVGILIANSPKPKEVVYIIFSDTNNIDWEEITKLIAEFKLKNIRVFFTKNPIIKKFTLTKNYRVMELSKQYYYLYKEIANHPTTEDKTEFFETFFE